MTSATFHIRLALAGGEVVEDTFEGDPVSAELGTDVMHPCIERLVSALQVGEITERTLSAEEAFGVPEAERCVTLPRADFDVVVEPGTVVEFDVAGELAAGTVMQMDEESVRVDMNHPLAGHAIDVKIELLAREP